MTVRSMYLCQCMQQLAHLAVMNDMSVGFNRALRALGLPNPALDHKAALMALSLSVAYIHQSDAGAWSCGAFFWLNCSIFTLLSWMQLECISK